MIAIFLLAFTLSLFSFGTTPAAAGDVAGIDEAQFFDESIVDVCRRLANNGVRYRTHFVKAILDTNTGEVLSETQPEVMDVIEGNGNTFALVRQGMTLVPSTISGKISSYPIAIACKTGSPQLAGTLPDGTHYTNSVLIGYGPVQQPRFAVAVVIEYGGGGSNAAPVLRAAADWFAAAGMA